MEIYLKIKYNVYGSVKKTKISLTHFQPMFYFYTPWIHFSGGMEVEHWLNMG